MRNYLVNASVLYVCYYQSNYTNAGLNVFTPMATGIEFTFTHVAVGTGTSALMLMRQPYKTRLPICHCRRCVKTGAVKPSLSMIND